MALYDDDLRREFEALKSAIETMNGMAQLAVQQVSVLKKEIAELKALAVRSENSERIDSGLPGILGSNFLPADDLLKLS